MNTEPAIEDAPQGNPTEQNWGPEYVRSEVFLHGLFFLMAFGVLLLSFLMRSEGETAVFFPGMSKAMPDTCSSRRMFGIDCPGCGMTRGFISISSGQFKRAWHFNPASFPFYLFTVVQLPWHAMQIWRLKSKRFPIVTRWAYMAPIGMVVLLTINWIWKLAYLA